MDSSLIIYSSVFTLVSFIVLYKFAKQTIIKSLLIPLFLVGGYLIFLNLNKVSSDNNLELITEMPDF